MSSADIAWMLFASALVMLMSPGLALFYGGMVRAKNVLSVFMQVFMCMALGSILWVVVGYSIAFGDSMAGGLFGDPTQHFLLRDLDGIDETVTVIFQMMFAIITPALIVGAFAERMKFSAFLLFTGAWSILVYPVVAHWVWGGGIIDDWFGSLDFAGGTVIHINAGIAGLVTAVVLGKRTGWPKTAMLPHNLSMTAFGAGLLWFGWFGFNAGSAGEVNMQAVNAFLVTHIAAATASLFWVVAEWVKDGHPTTLGAASGAVAGLVGITPAAGYVGVNGALVIGVLAGVLCYLAVGLKSRFEYDDSLDVVGVHFVGGLLGALLTGFLATQGLSGEEAGFALFGKQLGGVVVTTVYSVLMTFVILFIADALLKGIRSSEEDEVRGLDLGDHKESGYVFTEMGG